MDADDCFKTYGSKRGNGNTEGTETHIVKRRMLYESMLVGPIVVTASIAVLSIRQDRKTIAIYVAFCFFFFSRRFNVDS